MLTLPFRKSSVTGQGPLASLSCSAVFYISLLHLSNVQPAPPPPPPA